MIKFWGVMINTSLYATLVIGIYFGDWLWKIT